MNSILNINMNEIQIQPYIEQLYEDERLTSALDDRDAQTLLGWGEAQLKSMTASNVDPAALDDTARQLRRVIRLINKLTEQKSELSDASMVQRLLNLVEETMALSQQQNRLQTRPSDQTIP